MRSDRGLAGLLLVTGTTHILRPAGGLGGGGALCGGVPGECADGAGRRLSRRLGHSRELSSGLGPPALAGATRVVVAGPGPAGGSSGDILTGLVYRWCMSRTNIDLDDDACRAVMERYQLSSKRDAVNFALRTLAAEPLTVEEARRLRGSGWQADLGELRSSRPA